MVRNVHQVAGISFISFFFFLLYPSAKGEEEGQGEGERERQGESTQSHCDH